MKTPKIQLPLNCIPSKRFPNMRKSTVALGVLTALYIPSLHANVEINGFASIVAGSSLSDDKSYYGYDKEQTRGFS